MADNQFDKQFETQDAFEERVIEIARVAKVVKGGRRFRFRVTVVVGDKKGTIGMGVGKANAVPDAMRKASERARKIFARVNTSPEPPFLMNHLGKVAGARVFLKPASAGTGVIAAGGVRAVLEVAGVRDILTKSMGSANVLNVVMATFDALDGLRSPALEAARRGKRADELAPILGTEEAACLRKKLPLAKHSCDFGASAIGYTKDQKATVKALGLRRLHQTVEHKDTPALRGMLNKIIHLIKIEE
jgi:small subunit ribosomal protein S5